MSDGLVTVWVWLRQTLSRLREPAHSLIRGWRARGANDIWIWQEGLPAELRRMRRLEPYMGLPESADLERQIAGLRTAIASLEFMARCELEGMRSRQPVAAPAPPPPPVEAVAPPPPVEAVVETVVEAEPVKPIKPAQSAKQDLKGSKLKTHTLNAMEKEAGRAIKELGHPFKKKTLLAAHLWEWAGKPAQKGLWRPGDVRTLENNLIGLWEKVKPQST